MRRTSSAAVALMLTVGCAADIPDTPDATVLSKQPNILLVMVDDMGLT